MHFFFSNALSAAPGQASLGQFFVFAVITEAIVMALFKLNSIARLFLYSLIVNAVSMGINYLLVSLTGGLHGIIDPRADALWFAVFFGLTVFVEGSLLVMLNKKQHKNTVWLAAVIMNLASCILSYIFFV